MTWFTARELHQRNKPAVVNRCGRERLGDQHPRAWVVADHERKLALVTERSGDTSAILRRARPSQGVAVEHFRPLVVPSIARDACERDEEAGVRLDTVLVSQL